MSSGGSPGGSPGWVARVNCEGGSPPGWVARVDRQAGGGSPSRKGGSLGWVARVGRNGGSPRRVVGDLRKNKQTQTNKCSFLAEALPRRTQGSI